MYEFGDEPYGTDYPSTGNYQTNVSTYATYWKNSVPQLKAINPNAKFMGPSSPGDLGTLDVMLAGMKNQGVTPDAVSYHYVRVHLEHRQPSRPGPRHHQPLLRHIHAVVVDRMEHQRCSTAPRDGRRRRPHAAYVTATINSLIGHCDAAFLFDIASQDQYPTADLDMIQCNAEVNVRAKGSYNGMADSIAVYHP